MDKEVLSQVESIGENDLNEAAFGSLKKMYWVGCEKSMEVRYN
jgi:hypothetical protein